MVTYRVVDLMFDEKTSGASTRQRVAEVVQHELAHQWFGNLVTMDFWDGLWLNEGFATWMSWYSCNKFYPEWKIWQSFVIDDLQSALSLDSLRSSHPIEVPVKRADEINQIFDAISYSKGSCVLRMISKILWREGFLGGCSAVTLRSMRMAIQRQRTCGPHWKIPVESRYRKSWTSGLSASDTCRHRDGNPGREEHPCQAK